MMTFDQVGDLLDQIAEEFPPDFFTQLNGGIARLPDELLDPKFPPGEMYILGEYCHNQMGRYINIYYGSFLQGADLNCLTAWIYYPILPYPCPLVQIKLGYTVMPLGGGGKHLQHHIRRTLAPYIVQLSRVTDYGNIRLYQRVYIVREITSLFKRPNGERTVLDCF